MTYIAQFFCSFTRFLDLLNLLYLRHRKDKRKYFHTLGKNQRNRIVPMPLVFKGIGSPHTRLNILFCKCLSNEIGIFSTCDDDFEFYAALMRRKN